MRGAIEKPGVKHRPALTTRREFGEFVRDLRDTTRADPLTKLCARFGLLTWTRPKELRQARWEQFDLDAAEWRIPAIEMKTGKHLQAHTVPLSPQALALLPGLRELSGHTDRLFPSGGNAGGVISENTINNLFWRMGYADRQSHHGLRASARLASSARTRTLRARGLVSSAGSAVDFFALGLVANAFTSAQLSGALIVTTYHSTGTDIAPEFGAIDALSAGR